MSVFKNIYLTSLLMLTGLSMVAPGVQARELPEFTQLVERYGPAVVNISTKQKVSGHSALPKGLQIPELPKGGPWDDLFRHFFGQEDLIGCSILALHRQKKQCSKF